MNIDNYNLAKVEALNVPYLLPHPILGYNPWYALEGKVSETNILETADLLISKGLYDKGYNWIGIDGRWGNAFGEDGVTETNDELRDSNGVLIPSKTRFPNGMKVVADKLHEKGFKAGIYSSPGQYTCNNVDAGSLGYEELDAKTFSEWGFDLLKYDKCTLVSNTMEGDVAAYSLMAKYLYNQEHPMVLAICQYGRLGVFSWASKIGHTFRVAYDPVYDWDDDNAFGWNGASYMTMYEAGLKAQKYIRPNCFPDLGVFNMTNKYMTDIEKRTFFGILCMFSAQIWLSSVISEISEYQLSYLKNELALSVNQNNVIEGCQRIYSKDSHDILYRRTENGYAIFFINKSSSNWEFKLNDYLSYFPGIPNVMKITKVWEKEEIELSNNFILDSHDSLFLLFENV